jgi:hypothetical protein
MVGQIVFLDGELVLAPGACAASPWCGRSIVGLTIPHAVLPADALAAASLVASNRTKDLYALRIGSTSAAGLVGFTVLGRMRADIDTVLWSIETLAPGAPGPPRQRRPVEVEDLFEVSGWIVRTPFHSCPSIRGMPCSPTEDYLTSEPYQPVRADGSSVGALSETSLDLVSGSYDRWAPEPTRRAESVDPRRVTLLVRPTPPCGSNLENAAVICLHPRTVWEVVARLDPPH